VTTINHTLHRPDGATPAVGVTVNVRLVTAGYVTTSKTGILSSSYTTTDASGAYSLNLTAQSAITPAGTYYIVTHELLPHAETLEIQVPDGAGPFALADCVVSGLITPGDVAVSQVALDSRLAALGGIYAPVTEPVALTKAPLLTGTPGKAYGIAGDGSTALIDVTAAGGGFSATDNGDGTFTLTGNAVTDNGDGTYTVAF
jgi:hypothetical protein